MTSLEYAEVIRHKLRVLEFGKVGWEAQMDAIVAGTIEAAVREERLAIINMIRRGHLEGEMTSLMDVARQIGQRGNK